MKIAVRVDASSAIGTGHFMRCLALANTLKQQHAQVRFISRHLPDHLRSMLEAMGHEFSLLDSAQGDESLDELAHAHWLGVSQLQDAAESIQALSDITWDWLIVDHYALDSRWETMLRKAARRILVIDDLADRQHDCDLLLDQNLYADMEARYIGKVLPRSQLLLGPRYALLRDEFRQLHEQIKPRIGPVQRILVFFGGIDSDNYTRHAIEALSRIEIAGLLVDVVIGVQHPYGEQIKAACAQHGFTCHVQTDKMAELMVTADMAIGAGGSATWERCCLGLPALAICTAENQRRQLADAARKGLLYSPEIMDSLDGTLQRHARALMENNSLRELISLNSLQMVNGRGVLQVVASMGCADIEMRMARLEDSEQLFRWRNHPSIREVSRNTDMIEWQDHQKWLAAVLADPNRILLIGQSAGESVGVIRFDVQNDVAEISIYLVPEKTSSGMGRYLLHSAEQWLVSRHPEMRRICAHVLGKNERSQRLFSGAGYQIESACYSKTLH